MSSPPPKHSLSSPTSGNTPHPVLPTPSSSTSVSIRQNNRTSQLRQELEQQLVEKQKQLQESSSGIGKNVLARQVSQLQDRIKEIDSNSNDDIHPVTTDRLRSLERDLSAYRTHPLSPGISSIRNKEKLMTQRSAAGLDPLPSPSTSTLLPPTHGHDSTSLLPLPPPPTGSTPTKRRSKIPNTDRRNTDIEFATEIGQGLLLEVRKMQALLQEKEEKLRTLENQKADLERAAEAMAKQMRQREENEEKLKEETWNLELAKQELTISVTELQQNLSKANVEQNKLAKQVNTLRTEIEQLRDREEKLTNTIENMKQRHEQDMSSIRRHAAAIQREKTDQSKQIEALTSELAIAKAQSRIHKNIVPEVEPIIQSNESTDEKVSNISTIKNDTSPSSTPPPSSPKQTPTRNQAMEVETLKTSLAHAHRMVSNLRSNLHKEKTEKFEFKKLLADSQETIEQLQNDPRMWVDAGPTRASTSSGFSREDGLPIRRPHKASTSTTTRRRVKKNSTAGKNKLKPPHLTNTTGDDSVYSYASMSDDSEDVDSFDDSDTGFDNVSKKKNLTFTPLSSELSQSQLQDQKPIMVDAQVNTDPTDNFMLPTSILEDSNQVESPVTGSLGDELGRAMSQKSPEGDITGGLIAGVGTTLGIDALSKIPGIEIYTQTEDQPQLLETKYIQTELPLLHEEAISNISIAPTVVELEMISQPVMYVEPEDPAIALAATAAAVAAGIAASRSEALQAAVDCSTQFDPEIALADTEAIIAKSRAKALENSVDGSTQFDADIALATNQALIAESRTKALENAVDSSTQFDSAIALADTESIIAASRTKALESAIDGSTQFDADIALATNQALIAESRTKALENAVDSSTQFDSEIALANTESIIAASRTKALESAIDGSTQFDADIALADTKSIIASARAKALEYAVDTFTQSDEPVEDPSVALAAAAATAAAVAAGIAEYRANALESSVDCGIQSEPEDPSIALAATAAAISAARSEALQAAIDCSTQCDEPVEDPSVALAAAVAAGIDEYRSKAIESSISTSTQYEEDPSIAESIAAANAAATASAVAAGIANSRSKALESAINTSTQYEEDPAIASAAAEATAAAVAAGIAEYRSKALESAVHTSTQSEEPIEDPSIALAAAEAASAATAAAVAAGIIEARSKALESAIDTSTQSETEDPAIAEAKITAAAAALRAASLEEAINTSTQCDPEDPSIAANALASAIAASRSEALEAAIDTFTQSDEIEEDPSIAAAAIATAIAASRLASIEAAIDISTQFEGPSVIDQETQIEQTESIDSGVQSIPVDAVDASIQYECVTKDAYVQNDTANLVDHETQYDILGVDHSTQSDVTETSECGVQSDEPLTSDAYAQHEVESNDIGVQYEESTQDTTGIIPIPLPVPSRTFSESEDEFFDANSKPSSRRTIDSSMFNNSKPASRSMDSKLISASVESELDTSDAKNSADQDNSSKNRTMMATAVAAATAVSLANNATTKDNKHASSADHDSNALNGSVPSEVKHDYTIAKKSVAKNIVSPEQENNDPVVSVVKDNIQELNNATPSKDGVLELGKEKMYSKSEIDALIAAAVASALANASENKDDVNTDLLEDSKRHTCDMSFNKNAVESTSDMEEVDDQNNDEEYGNVLVHCPREEDTITSLPYDEVAQRRRDRSMLPNIDTSPLDARPLDSLEVMKPLPKKPEQDQPELTVGPSLVFSQEPEEPEEPELTSADVPQRPSNPPPRELLNKASLSSTFTDARSMSPSSLRSKGKAPMEYSDIDSLSPRSHDDLQRSAVLQQQQQQNLGPKRGSISISSVSTNNTNEQLRSINSSQYDAVTRSMGATDPAIINLITQTMIGDWLLKYTRKAVGGGLSERRHQRYFWIHPYTRTLYWSTAAPGVNGNEIKAKSAMIENIRAVPDFTNAPDGTPNQSLLIQTSHRQIKLTAPTLEKHELWLEAITHLLSRDGSGKGLTLLNDSKKSENPNNRSFSSGSNSLLNRPSLRHLHDIFQQPSSAPSTVTTDDHTDLDYDDDEALEDVRMCCNGKHHVSKLEKDHNHRHQYRKRKSRATITTT